MPVLLSIRVAIASPSDSVHLEFKISSSEHQPGSGGRRGHGRISPHLKITPWPHGTFSASHLFSWILQTEQLTENNRYVQLVVHLGNGGAVRVDVHHEPFQRRRGFKCCQLCQSDNWNQSTSLGFVWLHVWSAVISDFMILSLIVGCVAVLFPPPSSSVVRVVFVFSAILHCSRVLTCLLCTFHRQHQRSKSWQDPTWKLDLAAV